MSKKYRYILRFTAILLLSLLLTGCGAVSSDALDAHVREMLDLDVKGDCEASYALLYPGLTDEETYKKTFAQILEYFPVTEGYTMTMEHYGRTKRIGTDAGTVEDGQYKVEFDGQVFHAYVEYVTNKQGSGFTVFRIVSQQERKRGKTRHRTRLRVRRGDASSSRAFAEAPHDRD